MLPPEANVVAGARIERKAMERENARGARIIAQIALRGNLEVVDGVQKNIIGCNWKLAVDNLFDWYHPQISHASAMQTGFIRAGADENGKKGQVISIPSNPQADKEHRVVMGEYDATMKN